MATRTLESMLVCTKEQQQEKKARPQPEQALKCPRCDSTNTKFCYYNNYSLTQPRYFCKSCRRYWTKGGTLRNVPVGGGCRKNKRSSLSSSSSSSSSLSASSKRSQDQSLTPNPSPLSSLSAFSYDSSDLSLAFARLHNQSTGQLGFDGPDLSMLGSHHHHNHTQCDLLGNPNSQPSSTTPAFLEALRNGFIDTPNGFQSFYYGMGNNGNNLGHNGESVGVNSSEEIAALPYEDGSGGGATSTAVTVTTIKQELCINGGREGDQSSKVLWGFPWQLAGDGNNFMGDLDSGKGSWNGSSLGSSWHGLVNSPLM
ncbi:hypothetical protein U1Q18_033163 [Sarracenia purpurea var. burkii]